MLSKDEARKYLSDVVPENCFWVNNGPILRNLEELENAIRDMSEETFKHHANGQKNDFSTWVGDCIGDKKLANDLLSSKNKESALKKLGLRLNSLKKKGG